MGWGRGSSDRAKHAQRFDRAVAAYHGMFTVACGIARGERVLDIGCGTGQTTRDAAGAARPGQALGVDLSAPMIELARRLAAGQDIGNVSFEQADAQIHPFPAGSFGVAISRTGTMFFGDPAAAFTNIGRALRPGGRLVMLAWQGPGPNEWVRELSGALAAGLEIPAPPTDAPACYPSLTPAVPGPCWPPRDSRMSGSTRCTSRCGSVPIPTTRTCSCSA